MTRAQVVATYLRLGYTHILPKGTDHILFVLGIFLLSIRLKPILMQVTAFTVAHTITLALTIYGVVSLSPRVWLTCVPARVRLRAYWGRMISQPVVENSGQAVRA